jgi:hypothetical protein
MSEILDMLRDVPLTLAAAWGGWVVAGLVLLLWHLRARESEREAALLRASVQARSKSGVRSAAGPRKPVVKPAAPDAFGELEALLDPPSTTGVSRRPGD